MTWRNIKSAPKDGTHILLYGRCEWCDYGDTEDEPRIVVGYYEEANGSDNQDTNWRSVTDNPYMDSVHATHWKPLPNIPKI